MAARAANGSYWLHRWVLQPPMLAVPGSKKLWGPHPFVDEVHRGEEQLIRALRRDSNFKNLGGGQVWWSIPLIPACRGPREEDLSEFEAHLVYLCSNS